MRRAMKPCAHIPCGALVPAGVRYCPAHARQVDTQRGTAAERLYDAKWRAYREQYLAKHPWCVECAKEGKRVFATVVDHIKAHKGDLKLFWDPTNHRSLCATHHNRKTVLEDGGFGRAPRG